MAKLITDAELEKWRDLQRQNSARKRALHVSIFQKILIWPLYFLSSLCMIFTVDRGFHVTRDACLAMAAITFLLWAASAGVRVYADIQMLVKYRRIETPRANVLPFTGRKRKQTEENKMTFLEQFIAGTAPVEKIEDFIEEWHESESELELHEYLGMDEEEYGEWVTKGDSYLVEKYHPGKQS